MFDPPPSEAQEGITTLPLPFDDADLLHVLDTDEEDQDHHDLGIETKPHEILYPYPAVAAATVLPKFLKFWAPPHHLELL